jgi:tetratricopeptide (TPR) repeat protein
MDPTRALKVALAGYLTVVGCAFAVPALADHDSGLTQNDYTFCGADLGANAFGRPVDYTDPADKEHVAGIEFNHLSRDVETLVRGRTGDSPLDDLAYTLRQVPNHYRALSAMANFQLKNGYGRDWERNNIYTADCYFRRALNFRPNDPVLHLIYGVYLHKTHKLDAALNEYLASEKIDPKNAELHYNLGLLYVDQMQYDLAREQAKQAYELGYPLNGLRARLERAGRWTSQ